MTTTTTGVVLHPSGVIVPKNQFTPAHYTGGATGAWVGVPDPVASCIYEALPANGVHPFDVGFDDNVRIFANTTEQNLPGNTGTPSPTFQIDYWLSAGSDTNTWNNWTVQFAQLRYLRARLSWAPSAGSVFCVSKFYLQVDSPPKTEQSAANVVVSIGGTTISFNEPYHTAPQVQATVIGTSALTCTVSNITATSFVAQVWDHTGADVGGTISWQASGE